MQHATICGNELGKNYRRNLFALTLVDTWFALIRSVFKRKGSQRKKQISGEFC